MAVTTSTTLASKVIPEDLAKTDTTTAIIRGFFNRPWEYFRKSTLVLLTYSRPNVTIDIRITAVSYTHLTLPTNREE